MKSFIFASASIAALLYAGAASAQAAPNMTTQTVSSHSALIDQINSSNDKATINQNDGSVADTGAGKDAAVVLQGFAGVSSQKNIAAVDQSGAGQRALTMQATALGTSANTVTITQTGDHNQAFGYQNGSGNTATVTQSMTQGASLSALNAQGVSGSASSQNGVNAAVALRQGTISQARSDAFYNSGQSPAARVVQDWATNDVATVDQSGTTNNGLIVQSFEDGSTANLTQSGSRNSGVIRQQGSAGNGSANTATLTQTGGSDNGALIAQIDSIGSVATLAQTGGRTAIGYVYQQGPQNSASVTQNGTVFSTVDVRQAGGFDTATVTQNNAMNSSNVLINQGLSNSWASVNQMNTNASTATINQGVVSSASFRSGR